MAEAEAPRLRLGDEDAVLHRLRGASRAAPPRPAPWLRGAAGSGLRVRLPRPGAARPGPGGSRRATRCSSRSRRATGSSTPCPPAAARSSSAKKGLPSERATIVSVIAAGREAPARAASSAVSSSRPSGPSSSTSAEPERRAPSASLRMRAADAGSSARQVASSRTGRSPKVVREEDDQIERRGIGPVQILQHEQHRRSSGAPGEQRQRRLEHPKLRARRLPGGPPGLPERAERLRERQVRQLRADQIDRAANEDLEPGAAGTPGDLRGEPGLADTRLSRDQDGRTRPRPRSLEHALKLPELACAPDKHLARASLHSGSIAQQTPWQEGRS